MKKLFCLILVLVLSFSFLSVTAFADMDAELQEAAKTILLNMDDLTDDWLSLVTIQSVTSMYTHGILTIYQAIDIIRALDIENLHNKKLIPDTTYETLSGVLADATRAPANSSYSFGQGTYIVGQDLQPGTYDVKCDSVADEGYSDSIGALGDFYSGMGMDDYSSAFGSLGDMYSALEVMTINIQYANGTYANYLTLKSGETARVILENGMRVELKDGTSTFTFVR